MSIRTRTTPHPESPASGDVQAKFAAARRELNASLIERDAEIDAVLTALVARQHVCLIGPPGTGKSMLLSAIMRWMGGRTFVHLMTKFSTPEEIFGPISIAGLKADQYRRITTGMLPEATGCCLEEIWKSSSAILNTLLTILNERVYDSGDGRGPQRVPLQICVAASNEWPGAGEGGRELGALFDRFLIRKAVKPIASAAGRQRLLWGGVTPPAFSTTIAPAEVDLAHATAMALPWGDEAREALESIIRELAKEGIRPGDRRLFQSVGAARAAAWLTGAADVQPDHLEMLAHVLWDDPEQATKCGQVVARIANPIGLTITTLLLEAEGVLEETDVKQLASAATATAKLQEISKKLAAIPHANSRAAKANEYVRGEIRRIRLATVEDF